MIHRDSGLVSSEAPTLLFSLSQIDCSFTSSHLFSIFFFLLFLLSLRPAEPGLSCSPTSWNASPTRCWEELVEAYKLILPPSRSSLSRCHSLGLPVSLLKLFSLPPSPSASLFPTSSFLSRLFITLLFSFSFLPTPYIIPPSLLLPV